VTTPDPQPIPERPAKTPRPTDPEAIFVVGVSRSGTTLMSRVLDHHPRIAIAPENHFMRHLLPWMGVRHDVRRLGDLCDDAVVGRLATMLSDGSLQSGTWARENSPFFRWLPRNYTREQLETRLLEGERSERGVFTTLLRAYAEARGKSIIGEKTPAHVACVDELLDWYPGGKVIHIIRDPRGIYVSELRRRSEHAVTLPYRVIVHVPPLMRWFIVLEVAWAWRQAVGRHRQLARSFPDAYTLVRFEDLVTDPDTTIPALCARLGVETRQRMLRQKVVSKGENLGDSGFDADAAVRWRRSIGLRPKRVLQLLLRGGLEEMGYPKR